MILFPLRDVVGNVDDSGGWIGCFTFIVSFCAEVFDDERFTIEFGFVVFDVIGAVD